MTDDQRAKMMMYHRVSVFVTVNAADFTGTVVPGLVTELDGIGDAMHAAAAIQEVGTGVNTADRSQKRELLVKLLNKIENTGKAIGKFQGDEAVIASFNLDPAYSRMADEQLVSAADALQTAATAHSAAFQSRGFAATFLADLQTARDAFHDALPAGSTVEATETIVQKILRADVIVEQFDVTVGNAYDADNPATAPKKAAYDSARIVIRTRSTPLEVALTATRSGNDVTGSVTLSRPAETGDIAALRWREQGSSAPFTTSPATIVPAGTSTASLSVTVTTANPVAVVARLTRNDGSQFESAAVVV